MAGRSVEASLLEHVFSAVPDGILVIDDEGTVRAANPAALGLTGYPLDELLSMPVEQLVPGEARSRHRGLRQAAIAERVERPMSGAMTLALVRADGELIPVEIALTALADEPGWYVAALRDVTERIELRDRLDISEEVLLLAQERERIARDLHDTVLQRLFGLGLELQAAGMHAEPRTADRLGAAVDEIDRVIREVRTVVFTLGSAHREGSFGQELGTLIAQASRLLGFTPHVRLDGPVEAVLTTEVRAEMVASLREALSNVARHAAATEAHVELVAAEGITLTVTDNGKGLGSAEQVLRAQQGNGLRNLVRRAESIGGRCTISNAEPGGTVVAWSAPLPRSERAD